MRNYYLKDYAVLKDFLSQKSRRIYKVGEIYSGSPDSRHTKILIEGGFIKDTCCTTAANALPTFTPIAKSKLLNIEIADRNYTEGDKEHFTFGEALEIEKKMKKTGWRLPTRSEWAILIEEFGDTCGILDHLKFIKTLKLPYAGYVYNSALNNVGFSGRYWSSTANSSTDAYRLGFSSSNVTTSNLGRYIGSSVRLVRDVVEGKMIE